MSKDREQIDFSSGIIESAILPDDISKQSEDDRRIQLKMKHLQFRAEILELTLQGFHDPKTFVEIILEKLLVLSGADQAVYHGTGEKKIIVNSKEMEELGEIPEDYCAVCPHSDIRSAVYKDGYTAMTDGKDSAQGIPVYEKCPVKSILSRVLYHNGEPYGYLSIHYLKDYHKFTDYGQETFLQIAEFIQSIYAQFTDREKSERALSAISTMTEDFDYIAAINENKKTVTRLYTSDKFSEVGESLDHTLPANERLDRFFKLIVHPDDMEMFREKSDFRVCMAVLEKNPNYKFEFRTLYGGKEEYYRIKFAYMPDDHSTVILGLLNIDEQVRREMENAILKEKAEMDEQLHEQMGRVMQLSDDFQAIFDVDMESGVYDIFSYDTAYFEDVLVKMEKGVNFYADTLKDVEKVVYPEDRALIRDTFSNREYIRSTLAEQGQFTIDYRLMGAGGEPLWYRVKVVKKTGDENHFLVGVFYVDEKIRKEAEYKKSIENALSLAQEATEAKSNFLFNMSHDIRTPMNAITGFTNMAVKHIDDREKVIDCLHKTQKAGAMLLSLINNVLEVSRIEAGHANLDEQPGDVFLSFANISTTMQELASTKDIRLTFSFGAVRDRFVYADFSRCMRIFVNIISNAIKYTPEGGSVDVYCEQVGEAKDGMGTYKYTITDNGIGMSEEFQEHIYDQFSRERTSTVSGIQGTGLGMSVVKSFVDLLGGEISVKSRLGEGTTFTILLPFRLQDEAMYTDPNSGEVVSSVEGNNNPTEEISFNGKNVLLVEDNELNREIALDILEEAGFVVDTAEDGDIAVEMMRKVSESGDYDYYDAILMDIQMPRMNGYEATRHIRELPPVGHHVPIIAVSANAFEEDKRKSLESGMNDHISKPIDIQKLKETLAKYL